MDLDYVQPIQANDQAIYVLSGQMGQIISNTANIWDSVQQNRACGVIILSL